MPETEAEKANRWHGCAGTIDPGPVPDDDDPGPAPMLHPAVSELLAWFRWEHLPAALANVSRPFCDLAHRLALQAYGELAGAELTTALRKLLEAKDAAVRAYLFAERTRDFPPTRHGSDA